MSPQLQSQKNHKEENLVHWIHCISVLAATGEAVAVAAAAALYVVTGGEEVYGDLTADWTCDVPAILYQQDSVVPVPYEHDVDQAYAGEQGDAETEWDYGTHTLLYVERVTLEGGNEAAVMPPCLQPLILGLGNVTAVPLKNHVGGEGSCPHF